MDSFVEHIRRNRALCLPLAIHHAWYQGTPQALHQALRDLPERYLHYRPKDYPFGWQLVKLNELLAHYVQLDTISGEKQEHCLSITLLHEGDYVGFSFAEFQFGDFDLMMALQEILLEEHSFMQVSDPFDADESFFEEE